MRQRPLEVASGGALVWTIRPYAGTDTPEGYLICNGANVSRETYVALFTAIGTTHGVGDGSTTFTLPDLKGKTPVGYNTGETEFNTVWKTGGAKTHTLNTTEMPAHSHTLTWGGNTSWPANGARHVNDSTWNITTHNAGSNGAHNNLQPYMALNYIIKT